MLKWVARVATSDKTGEVEELIHRHTVNWYRDNQQLEDCWEAEEFVPSLSRVMTTFNTVANGCKTIRDARRQSQIDAQEHLDLSCQSQATGTQATGGNPKDEDTEEVSLPSA